MREPRPLDRTGGGLRDIRLILVATDDRYAPRQYFGFFQFPNVQVRVIPTPDGAAGHAQDVLDRLLQFEHEEGDERWLVLDTDHFVEGQHVGAYIEALQRARRAGVKLALSRPCFEYWLLLHHREAEEVDHLSNARQVAEQLREALGEYNKSNLKREHYPVDKLVTAARRAQARDAKVGGGMIPDANTTRVYQLLKSIWEIQPEWRRPKGLEGFFKP